MDRVVAGPAVDVDVAVGGEVDVVVAGTRVGCSRVERAHGGGRDQVVAAAEVEPGVDVLEPDVVRVAEQEPLVRVRPLEGEGAAAGWRGEGDILVGRHACAARCWMVREYARAGHRPDGRRASLERSVPRRRDRSLVTDAISSGRSRRGAGDVLVGEGSILRRPALVAE